MKEIHLLSKNERGLFFKTASDIKEMPLEIIEKDYWVVWVLEGLFSLEKLKPYLTFFLHVHAMTTALNLN